MTCKLRNYIKLQNSLFVLNNKLTSLDAFSIHEPPLPLNFTSKTNVPPFGGESGIMTSSIALRNTSFLALNI